MSTIEEQHRSILTAGGRYRPVDCRSHHKVAIVIPYRDREEHLRLFLQHLHPFLQRQQVEYGIYVVVQSGKKKSLEFSLTIGQQLNAVTTDLISL